MEKFAVSNGILVGLAAGLFLSVLAIGFFIGRETARKATNFGSISVGTVGAPPPAQPEIVQHPPVQSSESSVVGPPENFSPSAMVESVEPPPSPANPGGSPNEMDIPAEPVRTAVVAYFSSVDQIQLGQMRGDASEVAHKIVESLASADTSGLDGLIQRTESSRNRIATLSPPPPCTAHYQVSLVCLGAGLKMLHSMKQAVAFSDADGLFSLTAEANAILSCSDILIKEDKAIRQRFGLHD
jgi:hypothetical protein